MKQSCCYFVAFKHVGRMWIALGTTVFHLATTLVRVYCRPTHLTLAADPIWACSAATRCNCVAFAVPSIRKYWQQLGGKKKTAWMSFQNKMRSGGLSRTDLMEKVSWENLLRFISEAFKLLTADQYRFDNEYFAFVLHNVVSNPQIDFRLANYIT